ncbi:MAG: NAD(P)-dependent oxidoreductase [Bacteroidetes bacterium]|nr:NAD(P)-dependent oxidoreductase [Bacteroidota bacterium]
MNIAILGSSGEIGSRLSHHLIQKGYTVKLISRNVGVRLARLEDINHISIDLQNPTKLTEALLDVDYVVNCALIKEENNALENNFRLINSILTSCKAASIKKIIELSSIAVNPACLTHANHEEYSTEEDWYTKVKIQNEKRVLSEFKDQSITIIRAGIVYGPYMHWSKLAFSKIQQGTVILPCVRESVCHAIHVDDLCELIRYTILDENTDSKIIYGINPEPISWEDYFKNHAIQLNITHTLLEKMMPQEILDLLKIDFDELRKPSLKRSTIDWLRNSKRLVPEIISSSKMYNKVKYVLKASNFGLINYDSYINQAETSHTVKIYPNEFELKLYQSTYMPDTNSSFKYSIGLEQGVKSAATWWKNEHLS